MGGGEESPRGTNTLRVEELPQGDETSEVTLEGDRVPGADGSGRVGDGNSSVTQDAEGSTATCRGEEIESEMEPAAPLITL